MKRRLLISFCVMVMSFLWGDQEKEYFLQANTYYQDGKPHEALLLYQELVEKYPSVWFNQGLCYYALGKYAQSLAAFRHAQLGANGRLLDKVNQAIKKVQNQLHAPHDTNLYKMVITINSWGSTFFIQIFFLLFLSFYLFFVFFRGIGGLKACGLHVGLFCLIVICGMRYLMIEQRWAVVLKDKVLVFAGPHKDFHSVAELHVGQEVKVVQQNQSWYKVDFHGVRGWAQKTDLELII